MYPAVLISHICGQKDHLCIECYKRKVSSLLEAQGRKADFTKCNDCGNDVILRFGYNDKNEWGLYCQSCIKYEQPLEIIGQRKEKWKY